MNSKGRNRVVRTEQQSDIASLEGIFAAYFEGLRKCLPVGAAAVFRSGQLLSSMPGCEDQLDTLSQALAGDALDARIIISEIEVPGEKLVTVTMVEHQASVPDRAVCESLARLMAHGVAQHASAEKSRQAQTYLVDAMEALPEALVIFDEDERFVFWNSKFVEVYGFGVDLEVGRKFEDHLRACLAVNVARNAIGREEQWLEERMARFRSGQGAHEHPLSTGRWMRTQDRPLPHGGRIGIRTDITDFIEREQSFRLLFEANPSPMLIIDRETLEIVAVNDASTAFYGYSHDQMHRMTLPQIRPEKVEGEIHAMIERLETPEIAQKSRIHICADGSQRIVRVNTRFIRHRERECILAAVFDLTERFKAEEEMLRTRRFLRDVVDHVPVALFVKDMEDDGRYVLYNRAGESLFGLSQADVVGSNDASLMDPDVFAEYHMQDSQVLHQGMLDLIEERPGTTADQSEMRSIRLRKVALNDSTSGAPRYVLGLAEDVTEQRTREAEISRLALHDPLTGLPNRRLFEERLHAGLAALQPGYLQAVLFLDLDGFKAVNDTHGHPAGDRLLQMVAERIQAIARAQDTVARFGGDEFAVTVTIRNRQEAERIALRIISSLNQPYVDEVSQLRVSASIGISLTSSGTSTPQALVTQADAALYHAKRAGKNRFSVWERDVERGEDAELPFYRLDGAKSAGN